MKELQAFQPLRVPRKGDAVLTSQLWGAPLPSIQA
jgi:hypothetical protein